MTVIATASNPRFSVSRVDIDRGGPTYTKDTLRDLHALNPDAELYFITGADALASILSWQNWEEMFEIARFVGVSRPGYELDGKHIRPPWRELPDDALHLVEVPAMAISSTDCRSRAAGVRPVWYLVPDGVVQYVAKRDLYRELRAPSSEGDLAPDRAHTEAIDMATIAAQAAAAKLAEDIVVIDVSGQLVITDCFVIASASNERQVNAIVDEVEEKMRARRVQAGPPRGHPRGPLDAAGLRRHRGAHPAPGRAQVLLAGPAVEGLPDGSGGPRRSRGGVPNDVRRLVMLRHGQTDYNAGSRMQGQLDTDLSDLGRDQAVAAAEVLAKRQPLLIVSSDLRRALRHRCRARRALRPAGAHRHPAAGDASRRLAGADAHRGRCRGPRRPAGAGATTRAGLRTGARAGSTSPTAACRWCTSWWTSRPTGGPTNPIGRWCWWPTAG